MWNFWGHEMGSNSGEKEIVQILVLPETDAVDIPIVVRNKDGFPGARVYKEPTEGLTHFAEIANDSKGICHRSEGSWSFVTSENITGWIGAKHIIKHASNAWLVPK